MKLFLLYAIILGCAGEIFSQTVTPLKPGKLYEAGETLRSPRYGFTASVPEGWRGVLPRDTEVFMLMSQTGLNGDIYLFATPEGQLEDFRQSWTAGFPLSESITLRAQQPTMEDGMMISEVALEGSNIPTDFKGFAAVKCSPHGPCVTALARGDAASIDAIRQTTMRLMKTSTFVPPSEASPYADFNWSEFLSGKMLIRFTALEGGSKDNEIHLCADGTFSGHIHKKGFFKSENPQYKGKLKGTWKAAGVGDQGTLALTFKKLPSLTATMHIRDEKIFVQEERYFAAETTKCK